MRIYIIITLTLLCLSRAASGSDHAYLRISVSEGVEITDSISLTIWQHFVNLGSRFDSNTFGVMPTVDNPFEVLIDNPSFNMRVRLVNSKVGLLLPFVIVEPGDRVLMHIHRIEGKNVEMSFAGSGSAKFRYLYEFEKLKKEDSRIWQKISEYNNLITLLADLDELTGKWVELIEGFKTEFSPLSYHVLEADMMGYMHRLKLRLVSTALTYQTGENRSVFIEALVHLLNKDCFHPEVFISTSKDYIEYLYTKEKIKLLYSHKPEFSRSDLTTNAPYTFSDLYYKLKDNYKGAVRDQLLGYSLMNSMDILRLFHEASANDYNLCLMDSQNIVHTPAINTLLSHEITNRLNGQSVYAFALPDPDGKIVSLADFKGRIAFIDFWGDGCTACLLFKRQFEAEIYPYLKDSLDFVFISINVDRSKERWLNALPVYSNPEFVNLGLHDLGSNHPVFKHYNIRGLPFTMLMDREGMLVSSNLPKDSNKLLRLILESLEE